MNRLSYKQTLWATPVPARYLFGLLVSAVLCLPLACHTAEAAQSVANPPREDIAAQGLVTVSPWPLDVRLHETSVVEEVLARSGEKVESGQAIMRLMVGDKAETIAEMRRKTAALARLEALLNDADLEFPPDVAEGYPRLAAREKESFEQTRQKRQDESQARKERIAQCEQEVLQKRDRWSELQGELRRAEAREAELWQQVKKKEATQLEYIERAQEVLRLKNEAEEVSVRIGLLEKELMQSLWSREHGGDAETKELRHQWKLESEQLRSGLDELARRLEKQPDELFSLKIYSPLQGRIMEGPVRESGHVIEAGESILEIDTAQGEALMVEVEYRPEALPVKAGQKALVNVMYEDATPLGNLEGVVERVGEKASEQGILPVRVRCNNASVMVDGVHVPVTAGMAVSVRFAANAGTAPAVQPAPVANNGRGTVKNNGVTPRER